MYHRGPGFLVVVLFGSSPTPFPPLSGQQDVYLSQSFCVSPIELSEMGEGGEVGTEPNHTTARKPGPLNYTEYSLLGL